MSTNKINLRGIRGIKNVVLMLISLAITAFSISSCSILHALTVGYANYYSTAFCYKGQWSQWDTNYLEYGNVQRHSASNGDIIGLNLLDRSGNVYYRFMITDYVRGQKEYTGYVEYYVNDHRPTAEDIARLNNFVIPDYRTDKTPSVKRTAKARIVVVNDGRRPEVFNLWYDNIGVAISVRNIHWISK